jgi:hypothetical protein
MIVFKETVDDEKYMEIILTTRETTELGKYGSIYSKEIIEGEVINLGIRIDNFDKN